MKIKFKRDTSFRKQFFVPDSFAHPAKMDAQLLIWIVGHYTKAGETILDPMAGSGTTMLACTLGRNVIGVELEQKFIRMALNNWQEVKMRPQLGSTMGNCQILQGDARQLEGLVDKIVTSPPYAEANRYTGNVVNLNQQVVSHNRPANIARGQKQRKFKYADQNEDNISNLPYGNIDSIITSPPYDEGLGHNPGSKKITKTGIIRPEYNWNNPAQIGSLKSQSYLEAMLQVYQQCYKVLKDGGLMILVTKNFIRNKQVIRLDTDTIKLCEQAGFKFVERHYRKLPSQSFWRVIYHQKHPDVEQILNEDVLVFRKDG